MAMVTDQKLQQIVNTLKTEFNPTRILLFGSRAKGTHHPKSDYDLFLILKSSELRPIQRMQKAHRLLWDLHAAVDVFIYTQEEFDALKEEFGSMAHTVAEEGQELTLG